MSDRPKYETVQAREFKSSIPAHLLGKLSESERYMVETMSKLENQSDWLTAVAGQNRIILIEMDARLGGVEAELNKQGKFSDESGRRLVEMEKLSEKVSKLWDWKTMMSGKWAVLWALLLLIFSAGIKFLMDLWTKKGP